MRFEEALDRKGEDIERPPLMPVGTYRWMVSKMPEMDSIADGRFDVVDFQLKCVEATEDVDPDQLSEFGRVQDKVKRLRFLFNTDPEEKSNFDRTLFNMKRFMKEHLLIDSFDEMTLKEGLAESVNRQCLASIKWRSDKNDPEVMYDEIDRTGPVD